MGLCVIFSKSAGKFGNFDVSWPLHCSELHSLFGIIKVCRSQTATWFYLTWLWCSVHRKRIKIHMSWPAPICNLLTWMQNVLVSFAVGMCCWQRRSGSAARKMARTKLTLASLYTTSNNWNPEENHNLDGATCVVVNNDNHENDWLTSMWKGTHT